MTQQERGLQVQQVLPRRHLQLQCHKVALAPLLLLHLIRVLAALLPAMLQQQRTVLAVASPGSQLQPSSEVQHCCVAAALVLPKGRQQLQVQLLLLLQLLLTVPVQLPTTAAELAVSRVLAHQQLRCPAAAAAVAAVAAPVPREGVAAVLTMNPAALLLPLLHLLLHDAASAQAQQLLLLQVKMMQLLLAEHAWPLRAVQLSVIQLAPLLLLLLLLQQLL
jgi:hypothetical protein